MSNPVHDLYWQILEQRLASNALARDVFAEEVFHPQRLRSAEDYYRCIVWNLWNQAHDEGWRVPTPEEIATGAPPYFRLRQDGECTIVEPVGGRQ